jgi:hypothetical protein
VLGFIISKLEPLDQGDEGGCLGKGHRGSRSGGGPRFWWGSGSAGPGRVPEVPGSPRAPIRSGSGSPGRADQAGAMIGTSRQPPPPSRASSQ